MLAPNPPLPRTWIRRDTCPFECCTYRRWRARRRLPVYSAEGITTRAAFTIARGDSFDALTGNVHVERTGIAVALRPFEIDGADHGGQRAVMRGDRFALFEDYGEGGTHAWLRGHECAIDLDVLTHPGAGRDEGSLRVYDSKQTERGDAPDAPYVRVIRHPTWKWWVRIRTLRGRVGWLRIDLQSDDENFPVDNADACG